MQENPQIQVNIRMPEQLHEKILTERRRLKTLTGIEPSIAEVARMLIEKGIEANGKRRNA